MVINGNKRALPVVRVDYLRMKINVAKHFENGSAEENISFSIVIVAVKTVVALKIVLVVNKVVCNAVYFLGKNSAILASPANGNSKVCDKVHIFLLLGLYRIDIIRHNNARVVSRFYKSLRKRARYVRESAACRKRQCFTCCLQNVHNHKPPEKFIDFAYL